MHGRKLAQQVFSLVSITLLLSGCSAEQAGPTATPVLPTPTSYTTEVDWETAVEILYAGEVEVVTQLHSLDVTLTMKDGIEIHTVEPSIDAISQEVDKCGQPCSQIILVTE